jgi:transposase
MSHLVGPDVSAPARCRRDVGRNILSAPERAGRQGDLIVWNADFGQVALDYRVAPALCWPRAAQQKGAVEQLVGRGKRSFFTCRRFHDRADLERQLAAWLVDVKTMRPSRGGRDSGRAPRRRAWPPHRTARALLPDAPRAA